MLRVRSLASRLVSKHSSINTIQWRRTSTTGLSGRTDFTRRDTASDSADSTPFVSDYQDFVPEDRQGRRIFSGGDSNIRLQTPSPELTQRIAQLSKSKKFLTFDDWHLLLSQYIPPLKSLGVDLNADQSRKLALYLEQIWLSNGKANLFSKTASPERVLRSVIDTLIHVPHVPDCEVIADIGCGGGILSHPLAIAFPEKQVLAVDNGMSKRAFLHKLSVALDPMASSEQLLFPNISVPRVWPEARYLVWPLGARGHAAAKEVLHRHPGTAPMMLRCDLIVTKAFFNLPDTLFYLREYFLMGGRFMMWKGRLSPLMDEIEAAKSMIRKEMKPNHHTRINFTTGNLDDLLPHKIVKVECGLIEQPERYILFIGPDFVPGYKEQPPQLAYPEDF